MTKKTNSLLLRFNISTLWFNKCTKNKTKSNYLQLENIMCKELGVKSLSILRIKFRETLTTLWVYNQETNDYKTNISNEKKQYLKEIDLRKNLEKNEMKRQVKQNIKKLWKQALSNYRKMKVHQTSKVINLQNKDRQKRIKKGSNTKLSKIEEYKSRLKKENNELNKKFIKYVIQKKVKKQVHKIHLNYITPNQRYYVITKMNIKRRVCFQNIVKYTQQQVRLKWLKKKDDTKSHNLQYIEYHSWKKKLKTKKKIEGSISCYKMSEYNKYAWKRIKKMPKWRAFVRRYLKMKKIHLNLIPIKDRSSKLVSKISDYKYQIKKVVLSLKMNINILNLNYIKVRNILNLPQNLKDIYWQNSKNKKMYTNKQKRLQGILNLKLLQIHIEMIISKIIDINISLELNHIFLSNFLLIRNTEMISKYRIAKYNTLYMLVTISTLYKVAHLIGKYLVHQLEKIDKHHRVLRNFTNFLENTHRLKQIYLKGLKIYVTGKLGGKMRKSKYSYKIGNVQLQKLSDSLSYNLCLSYTKFGVIAVKIWLINENQNI